MSIPAHEDRGWKHRSIASKINEVDPGRRLEYGMDYIKGMSAIGMTHEEISYKFLELYDELLNWIHDNGNEESNSD